MAKPDILLENHGSVYLFRPMSKIGRVWIDENVEDDAQLFGGALVVEPRYVNDLAAGMQNDGLQIR